ncbi:sentrin-specific protease 6-like [Bos indicus x Bos taurus]|uniref:sentrin-specific protease 6-like n=1 Tax=Bos indicus x Bos taurus TaxID=30522 RepID=UPI000F7D17C8|nr:sentrin-specific protease 6-like [Bos indicus x Bos taurus]
MQLQMNTEDKVWNDCKGANKLTNLEEQYIILIFQNGLDPQATMLFENLITDIGIKNNVSDLFVKIPFDAANSRLTAYTGTYEESIKGSCVQKENKIQNFGNSIITTPLKRRKVISQETSVAPVSLSCQSSSDTIVIKCRSVRIGTLFQLLIEPVIFCLDFIKIQLEEPENDPVGITLNTSDLTKCEWCSVRKLPVVFLQTKPAVYQKLSMQLQMNTEDKVWNDCKGANKLTNLEEQYIILIFQNGLDPQATMLFENLITDIGIKNNVSDLFVKIPFDAANSRLTAYTGTYEESIKGSCVQKENKIQNFGNSIITTPLKRRKVISQETSVAPVSLSCQSSSDTIVIKCRSVRIGTLFQLLIEPVIFCLDFIKIQLEEPENDPVGITLNTSDLTKCEWCSVRKLPVVFLQTKPAVYQKLSMQLQMNTEDKVWNDCKGANKLTNLEEQYIILIFQNGLDPQATMLFENLITDIGIKNNVSDLFVKIPFDAANSRLTAYTGTYEESIKGSCVQKENKIQNVIIF